MRSAFARALWLSLALLSLLARGAISPAAAQAQPTLPTTPMKPLAPLSPGQAAPAARIPPYAIFQLPVETSLSRMGGRAPSRLAPAAALPPAPPPATTPTAAPAQGLSAIESAPPAGGAPPLPGIPNPQTPPATSPAMPYGSQLFTGQPRLFGPVALNRDYIIAPGDQIAVYIWGAYAYKEVQGVDPQGNIFIPQVGPIRVIGVTAAALNGAVTKAVTRVFTQNVYVYASLLSKQPVAVYVTGAVKNPGRYSGDRLDSPLQYIAEAGGIDPTSGSYRDIRILRGRKTLARIDLYAFLRGAPLPQIEFQVNDTIVVGHQRPTVTALGDVQNSYRFEIDPAPATGAELAALARPNPIVSNVSIEGIRDGKPYDAYVPLAEFLRMRLASGDTYGFASDYVSNRIFVTVTGQSRGPSSLVVPRSATLGEVLKLIAVDPRIADLSAIYLRRQSVALAQQQALDESLAALRRAVLTSRSFSTSDAAIHTEEAQMVEAFMEHVRQFKPQGRIVLAGAPGRDRMMFEPNDEIVIPAKSDVVSVNGEVRIPQTVIWSPDRDAARYVALAGGYTERADPSDILVVRPSGAVEKGGAKMAVGPGDQIMVMPQTGPHKFAIFEDIIHVLYEIAVSTGVTLRLTH
jgi:protein involved in polysaccharide export with SLBB domain